MNSTEKPPCIFQLFLVWACLVWTSCYLTLCGCDRKEDVPAPASAAPTIAPHPDEDYLAKIRPLIVELRSMRLLLLSGEGIEQAKYGGQYGLILREHAKVSDTLSQADKSRETWRAVMPILDSLGDIRTNLAQIQIIENRARNQPPRRSSSDDLEKVGKSLMQNATDILDLTLLIEAVPMKMGIVGASILQLEQSLGLK